MKFRARAAQAARLVLNADRTKPVGVQALNEKAAAPFSAAPSLTILAGVVIKGCGGCNRKEFPAPKEEGRPEPP